MRLWELLPCKFPHMMIQRSNKILKRKCILKEHKEAETSSSRNSMGDRLKKFQNTYKSR